MAIGISLAYLYQHFNEIKVGIKEQSSIIKKMRESRLLIFSTYLVTLGLLGFVTIYPLQANKQPMLWSKLHNSLFISLSRPVFLLCLCMLSLQLWLDNGLVFKRFLSLKVFLVLGRLSYSVYLVLPIIISILVSSVT